MAFYVVQFLTGLASAASLFLVASGLSIIFVVTRIVNFAHGAFYMLGAYVAFTLTERFSGAFGFWGGIVVAAFVVAAVGVLVEMVLLRRIYHPPELFQLLATFGLTLMVQGIVVLIWGPDDLLGRRAPGFRGAVDFFGQNIPSYDLFLIALSPIVLGVLWLLFQRTRWGVLVRAATQDRDMVAAVVLIVRPWGLFGKPEAAARRTPGLTVNPWRPLTSGQRLMSLGALVLAATLPLFAGNYALTVGSEIAIYVIFPASLH